MFHFNDNFFDSTLAALEYVSAAAAAAPTETFVCPDCSKKNNLLVPHSSQPPPPPPILQPSIPRADWRGGGGETTGKRLLATTTRDAIRAAGCINYTPMLSQAFTDSISLSVLGMRQNLFKHWRNANVLLSSVYATSFVGGWDWLWVPVSKLQRNAFSKPANFMLYRPLSLSGNDSTLLYIILNFLSHVWFHNTNPAGGRIN